MTRYEDVARRVCCAIISNVVTVAAQVSAPLAGATAVEFYNKRILCAGHTCLVGTCTGYGAGGPCFSDEIAVAGCICGAAPAVFAGGASVVGAPLPRPAAVILYQKGIIAGTACT